jgi:LCP family protein required for cell wall assembly
MKHQKKNARSLILPILGLFAGFIAAFFYIRLHPATSQFLINPLARVTPAPTPTPGPKPISLLLLGYGGPDHDGGYLTDTIIQAVVQPNAKRIIMITIPRDLAVDIPVSQSRILKDKINAAFAIGMDDKNYPEKAQEFRAKTNPGALAKKLVGEITGYPIDSYIAVSFEGFVKAIDVLGGVDVMFPAPFDDYRYPVKGKENDPCGKSQEEIASLSAVLKGDELEKQFPCRFEHLHIDKGLQHLDGELALKVARSRHSSSDFDRSQRQRKIIEAAKEKIFEIGFLPKAIPFFLSLGKDLKTDIDTDVLIALLPYAQELRSYAVVDIALSDENVLGQGYNATGQYVLYPKTGMGNWRIIHEFIQSESTKSGEMQ